MRQWLWSDERHTFQKLLQTMIFMPASLKLPAKSRNRECGDQVTQEGKMPAPEDTRPEHLTGDYGLKKKILQSHKFGREPKMIRSPRYPSSKTREGESMIKVKSIFSKVSDDDGFRVLVEPVWPWKANREQTVLDVWFRDLAPSPVLHSQYVHNQLSWEEFVALYHRELERCHGYFRDLQAYNHDGGLTIIHGSIDQERNIAIAVKMFMEKKDYPPDQEVNPILYLNEPLDLNVKTDRVHV